ncbi:5'-nucleotidase domain-containing protein DDB_G0275467 isoform X1 [Selaginella moellendorffii]|uniref:5'-nucleotidase domain-containing protein DDB_G0275467 isoform X1 n=1 Tax=Selaginella moellendorffii TaxID=88036 RepID=UPI000D1CFE2E|nr:5'-nucleotidase domain-containing protein DDB_G0275467 isoform X1 [Selaginella moellendorffii]|eukprot:XP_002964821.2 5'-nucleotidase domain-containing protein DDB_G0275467 isoform X1 [Selaginella moellendorffii]
MSSMRGMLRMRRRFAAAATNGALKSYSLAAESQGGGLCPYGRREHMKLLMEFFQKNLPRACTFLAPPTNFASTSYRFPVRKFQFRSSSVQTIGPRCCALPVRFFSSTPSPEALDRLNCCSHKRDSDSDDETESLGRCSYVQPPGNREEATEKLQEEFETAMKCFEDAPPCLDDIPKINPNGVYANHNLRLDLISVYGFDYDFTLAHYTASLQHLIYDLAKEQLVKELKYPESCLDFKYDQNFPIRGLYYDKKRSYLLKLDFFHCAEVASCFFGRRRLTHEEVEQAYGGKHISPENLSNLVPLMDLFCLSEVCLLSDVIQHFVDQKLQFDPGYVYEDVRRSVENIHRTGLLHKLILERPEEYLVKNEAVTRMLKRLKEIGKKTFIITNSPFPFVDGGMRYLFQEDGDDGSSWRDLFDVVVALSDKPNFYSSQRPFRHYDIEADRLTFNKVEEFEPHAVYYHGCLKDFLQITKWRGTEVLYFGDHLFSDLRGPSKAGWRTAAIIRELEREIATQNEDEYRIHQARYHMVQELLGKYHGLPVGPRRDKEKTLLLALRKERLNARLSMSQMFNRYFGSTFLTDTGKESAFAYNVQKYADVYTSRLENLMTYSSEAWLYTPFDVKILPHHIKLVCDYRSGRLKFSRIGHLNPTQHSEDQLHEHLEPQLEMADR